MARAKVVAKLRAVFVIARNASGRPTLMHRLVDGTSRHTACGLDMTGWTRKYFTEPFDVLYCRRCGKIG